METDPAADPPVQAEAKTPAGKARWECLNGRMPTSVPPPPEPVDPLPYLSPRPGLTYEGGGLPNL